ncbi:MAG: acetolactate synthase small subunit [Candidatus Omnitrophica bacterium]|nr:acetolactate synthase small subunit [Candidatus Omnitrophota bacterium]
MENNKKNIHTISLLVANKPGVLVRVTSAFARRGYNIDALVVSPSFDPNYSTMTITAQGDPATLDQIMKQTVKLVDVIHCNEHTGEDAVHQELALIKIKNVPANKPVITDLVNKFAAKIITEDENIVIIACAGTTLQLDEFETVMKKYGMIEVVRSGKLVMTKSKSST